TGENVNVFKEVDQQQIEEAVSGANSAFEILKTKDMESRAQLLDSIAEELEALGPQLIEICDKETGLGEARITGERGRTCGQLRAFATLIRKGDWQQARIDTAIPDREPLPKADIRRILRPLGTIAVFSASNFPLAFSTLGGDTASAIAAGNSVVVKAHPSHPGTSELCTQALEKAIAKNNFPPEMFAMLQGASPEVSQVLVQHPQIHAVGFTGSTAVGRILYNLGASRPNPIPVFAEMGSTNPLVVLPNAIAQRGNDIAQGLAGSITLGTGQFCTKPGLILLLKDEHSPNFVKDLTKAIDSINIGHFLNKRIKTSFKDSIEKTKAVEGITMKDGKDESGKIFEIDAGQFLQSPRLEEEIFGPAAIIISCEDIDQLIEVIAGFGGHLTGTIHSDEDIELAKVISAMERKVGRIILNGFPTGVEVCPSMHHG
ncbi:hypothetical protein LCGC14_2722060, partial [marine sediment metagenome]